MERRQDEPGILRVVNLVIGTSVPGTPSVTFQ